MQYFPVFKQKMSHIKREFSETVIGFHLEGVATIISILALMKIPFIKAV